ncbi:MAG: hypothetical protein IJ801_00020 [Lachnospiraceae bacterium]|nr:hypothetical protein [Lachnospiraceae bacterium]
MKHIVKSQLYQIRTDLFFMIALLTVAFLSWRCWEVCRMNMTEDIASYHLDGVCGGVAALDNSLESGAIAGLLYLSLILTIVIGKDYADKTVYCDILAGYTRQQAFRGRLLSAVIVGGSIQLITTFAIPFSYTIRYGWGNVLDGTTYLACIAICLLIFYRIIGEITLLTVVTKRYRAALFVTIVIGYAELVATMFTVDSGALEEHYRVWFLSLPAAELFLHPSQMWEYQDNADIRYYWIQMPKTSVVIGTIIISIVLGTGCLLLSSHLIKKRDMD